MIYSQLTDSDFDSWLALGLDLWPHYKKKKASLENQFSEILCDPNQTAFLCKHDNEAIAFINVSLRSDYVPGAKVTPVGYIEGIFVKPEYRKQGIAKKLIKLAEAWAKKYGCKELGSDAELANVESQKFHKSIGFKQVDVNVHYIKKIN